MPTLGRFIRRRRIELGMTQEQMAFLIGETVRQSEVSRLENDRITLPRRERLERIAEVLGVPVGELLVRLLFRRAGSGQHVSLRGDGGCEQEEPARDDRTGVPQLAH